MNRTAVAEERGCLLCVSDQAALFYQDKNRDYWRCKRCSLVFVPPEFHLSLAAEKARYDQHENDADDAGYRGFLKRIVSPVSERVAKGASGLDFGCGPTPLLADLLRQDGFPMQVYDPNYAANEDVLKSGYNFIVSTEVLEHLRRPMAVLRQLFALLEEGGILAVMTRPHERSIDFASWHYKNDRTHIAFYSVETFDWLSEQLSVSYERVDNDIFIFNTGGILRQATV
jgi:hypothetical protein